jgi:glycosyltransferase involved in cell wall biosynthesis
LKISIITVTYNSEATLEETILSVISQNHPEKEYIIIDGGSTDGTKGIIEEYRSHLTDFISEKDQGLYDAINKGISIATGEVVGILHSDDFYTHSDVLGRYSDLFDRSKADAIYSDLFYVDRRHTDKIIRKWKSGPYSDGSFVNGWMPPHPTFFVKRSLYEKYGAFNLTFKTAADYELMLRFIHKHKIRLSYLPEFTVKMRIGGASNVNVRNRINANLEDRRAWTVNGLKPRFYTLYLKPLRKILQFL